MFLHKSNNTCLSRVTVILVSFLTLPNIACAYLDPSSGSALISAAAATAAGFIYALKSLFYRFFGKNLQEANPNVRPEIIIFGERRMYWGTFRLIVEELICRKIHFRYLTLDVHDPALEIESSYMDSKLVSERQTGYTYIERSEASVMVATTPNIGAKGYPLKRSPGVKNFVHLFHSVSDIADYKKFSLDAYDTVVLVGDFQKKSIREIESKRALAKKKLITLGLPYLDELNQRIQKLPKIESSESQTILIGSSWGEKGCLRVYGTTFIRALAQKGFSIIVRPHPQSFTSEADFINQLKEELADFSTIRWDDTVSPLESMQASDLLISDISSIRFDFAFLFNRPVITLDIPKENLEGYEAVDLEEVWSDKVSDLISTVVDKGSIDSISEIVPELLRNFREKDMQEVRENFVANWTESAVKIVDYLTTAAQGEEA